MTQAIPLCVDLDGSLIHSDLLLESFLLLIKRNPLYLFLAPLWLLRGKAHLKAALANQIADPKAIPLYSHHQTRQSLFEKGWRSVTELDRLRARARHSQPPLFQPQKKEVHHA